MGSATTRDLMIFMGGCNTKTVEPRKYAPPCRAAFCRRCEHVCRTVIPDSYALGYTRVIVERAQNYENIRSLTHKHSKTGSSHFYSLMLDGMCWSHLSTSRSSRESPFGTLCAMARRCDWGRCTDDGVGDDSRAAADVAIARRRAPKPSGRSRPSWSEDRSAQPH